MGVSYGLPGRCSGSFLVTTEGMPPGGPARSVGFGWGLGARADVLVEPAVDRRGVAPRRRDPLEGLRAVQPRRRAEGAADVHALHPQQLDARVIDRVAARRALQRLPRGDFVALLAHVG